MIIEIKLFEPPDSNSLHFCLWAWMKIEVYKRKVGKRDELFSRILDAAVCIKKREDETQMNNTRSSHTSCKVQ